METAIVLFTRDLRVRDNPALALACARARQVVPLFVVDPALKVPPNRARFLAESIAVLRGELRKRGGDLVIRHGEPVSEVIRLAERTTGQAVFVAGDVCRYATLRQERLARECARHRLALEITPGHAVVPPGELRPAGGSHYRIFTPYWRVWRAAAWRQPCLAPSAIHIPRGVTPGDPPTLDPHFSRCLSPGGERAGRELLRAWLDGALGGYGDGRDDLAGPGTSRLSAYLRFGCISPIELARAAMPRLGGEEFCRQLAWRDFFHQVTAAFPDIDRTDYRSAPGPSPRSWSTDEGALDAWRAGQTCWPTATWPATPATGSGWPEPATTRGPAGCSTRCGRRPGSIMTATTCAATCLSWRACPPPTSTRPGSFRPRTAGSSATRPRW
jgi:deoxyribodipyrimidine photo-lyase